MVFIGTYKYHTVLVIDGYIYSRVNSMQSSVAQTKDTCYSPEVFVGLVDSSSGSCALKARE